LQVQPPATDPRHYRGSFGHSVREGHRGVNNGINLLRERVKLRVKRVAAPEAKTVNKAQQAQLAISHILPNPAAKPAKPELDVSELLHKQEQPDKQVLNCIKSQADL
jgi:hypothetical protein